MRIYEMGGNPKDIAHQLAKDIVDFSVDYDIDDILDCVDHTGYCDCIENLCKEILNEPDALVFCQIVLHEVVEGSSLFTPVSNEGRKVAYGLLERVTDFIHNREGRYYDV